MSAERVRVVGLTVGIGAPYADLAVVAARCFEHWTGFPAEVLGTQDLASSNVGHPAALRLELFAFTDADVVVYFDADWLCLAPWQLREEVGTEAFCACRDFVMQSEWPGQNYDFNSDLFLRAPADADPIIPAELRLDYIDEVRRFAALVREPVRWINTGLLVLHRRSHQPLLAEAVRLYRTTVGHHARYYEQPAFNRAIETLGVRCHLLARRFNVLAAFPALWPSSVTGLHIKPARHPEFIAAVQRKSIRTAQDVRGYFCDP